jgi:septal ring factor EnvC (AmiA/AmiB activator)
MRTHLRPTSQRRVWRATRLVAAVAALAGPPSACLRNPAADAATAQALMEISDQLGAMQQDNAALQNEMDSLRAVVARQDTALRRLANMAGVPIAP